MVQWLSFIELEGSGAMEANAVTLFQISRVVYNRVQVQWGTSCSSAPLHCTAMPGGQRGQTPCRVSGLCIVDHGRKCPRTGGFEHQLAYYSRHSAIQVVVGSRHTWLSGGCTWAVIKRIVKVRIAFWLLEVLPFEMWHISILLLLALSDNLPLTSSQPVFSSNLEAHGEYSSTILETHF